MLESNVFVERILPSNVIRDLTEEEMEVYRRPYREPGDPIVLVQEDSPREIGEAVVDFISRTGA